MVDLEISIETAREAAKCLDGMPESVQVPMLEGDPCCAIYLNRLYPSLVDLRNVDSETLSVIHDTHEALLNAIAAFEIMEQDNAQLISKHL